MQFIPNTRFTACIQRSFNFSVAAFRRLGKKCITMSPRPPLADVET